MGSGVGRGMNSRTGPWPKQPWCFRSLRAACSPNRTCPTPLSPFSQVPRTNPCRTGCFGSTRPVPQYRAFGRGPDIRWQVRSNVAASKTGPRHDCRTQNRFCLIFVRGLAGSDRWRLKPGQPWADSLVGHLREAAETEGVRGGSGQLLPASRELCRGQVIRKMRGRVIREPRDSDFI